MHTEILNSLPYIKIKNPSLKLLVDTGCYNSIIRPSIAEKYFPNTIFNSPSIIKTGVGEKETLFKANIPAFQEFQVHDITFILFDFHEYFDGIIGLYDLKRFNLSIDLVNDQLSNNKLTIPIQFRQPQLETYGFTVHSHEVKKVNVPVSHHNVDIIIPETYLNNIYFPETLTTAKNGFAVTEVFNYTSNDITVLFKEPMPCHLFSHEQYEHFSLFHMDNILPKESAKNSKTLTLSTL